MATKTPPPPPAVDLDKTLQGAGIGMILIGLPVWVAFEVWGRLTAQAAPVVQIVALALLLGALCFGALLALDALDRWVTK